MRSNVSSSPVRLRPTAVVPSPMREDQTPRPEDPYGIAKLSVEFDLAAAHRMFGLDHVIFRPHNVYGEFQNLGDPYRNVVGIFMNRLMQGLPFCVFGDGTQQRAFSYVGDIAPVVAGSPWVPAARNQVFNIGADVPYTVNELAVQIRKAMGRPAHPIEYLPPRNEVAIAYSDHSKARQVFGDHSSTALPEGLEKMAAWAWHEGIQASKPFEGVEVSQKPTSELAALTVSDPLV